MQEEDFSTGNGDFPRKPDGCRKTRRGAHKYAPGAISESICFDTAGEEV